MAWRRVTVKATIGAVALGTAALGAFYLTMAHLAHAETTRAQLPRTARNSIMHAYAAAETYAQLRRIGMARETARELTAWLGYANEWVETVVLWPRDTTREVYKDLHNNWTGVVAADALERCQTAGDPDRRLALIGRLAGTRALTWRNTDPRIPDLAQPLDVAAAIARFETDRSTIEAAARQAVADEHTRADTCGPRPTPRNG